MTNATQDFLERVWPDSGFYCLAVKDGSYFRNYVFQSPDAAAHHLANNAGSGDWYCALASFKEFAGNPNKGFRVQDNVAFLRTLFLDIDAGEAKFAKNPASAYQTQWEARIALNNFVSAAGLPQPMVMSSGFGIHAYWFLDRDYSRDEWQPWAESMKQACKSIGLRIDPKIPADSARVLRPAGTLHTESSQYVHMLEPGDNDYDDAKLFGALSAIAQVQFPTAPSPKVGEKYKALDILTSNLLPTGPAPDAGGAFAGCAQLRSLLQPGKMQPEPLWFAGLQIVRFFKNGGRIDGHKLAHAVSQCDPRYSEHETQRRLDRLESQQIGPTLCTTFEQANPDGCRGCKHRGTVTSPIALAYEAERKAEAKQELAKVAVPDEVKAEYDLPELPEGYEYRALEEGGGVIMSLDSGKIGGKTSVIEVTPYWCFAKNVLLDPTSRELRVNVAWLDPQAGWREHAVSIASFESSMAFGESDLLKRGLTPSPGTDRAHLMTFLAQCTKQLREQQEYDRPVTQMGWTDDNSFIIGDEEYRKGQAPRKVPVSAAISAYLHIAGTGGTLDGWRRMADVYSAPGYELHQIMTMVGAGSVLMRMTNIISGVVAFTGDTGGGKSSAIKIGSQFFMAPRAVGTNADTINSTMTKLTLFKDLVVTIDELSETKGKFARNLDEFFKALTQGHDKDRATFAGAEGMRTVGGTTDHWHSMFAVTSNHSVIDTLNSMPSDTEASQSRVLELRLRHNPANDPSVAEIIDAGVGGSPHYGHAGRIFIQYVVDNYDAVARKVVDTKAHFDRLLLPRIEAAAGRDKAGVTRYMSSMAACIVVATAVCNKLHLVRYDPAGMAGRLVEAIAEQMTSTIKERAARIDYLSNFFRNNVGTFLVAEHNLNMNRWLAVKQPRMKYNGIIEIDQSEGAVSTMSMFATPFREWCRTNGHGYQDVIDAWRKEDILMQVGDRAYKKRCRKLDFGEQEVSSLIDPQGLANVYTVKLSDEMVEEILQVERS